jgi:hypothetical protein
VRRLDTLERVDWFRVLADLQAIGWSNNHVSRTLAVPTATLYGWKNGSEPTHYDGDRLLTLWRDTTGALAVPRTNSPLKVGIPRRVPPDTRGH